MAMSKQTEALKLALEALEAYGTKHAHTYGLDGAWDKEIMIGTLAVMSIREALAQPRSDDEQPAQQQDIPDLIAGALGVSRGTAYDLMRETLDGVQQQEPVAKVCHDLDGHIGWNPKLTQLPDEGTPLYASQLAQQREPVAYIHRQGSHWEVSERFLCDDEKARGWTEEPLYTSPQPTKPWMSLTDEDKKEVVTLAENALWADVDLKWRDALMEFTEAKLKEKNA
jgi:hypothetical protein